MNLQSEATKISQTINAILNPNTSPKDRALCTEQCENYKTNTNPDDQYEISTFIIKQASCGNFDLNTLKFEDHKCIKLHLKCKFKCELRSGSDMWH